MKSENGVVFVVNDQWRVDEHRDTKWSTGIEMTFVRFEVVRTRKRKREGEKASRFRVVWFQLFSQKCFFKFRIEPNRIVCSSINNATRHSPEMACDAFIYRGKVMCHWLHWTWSILNRQQQQQQQQIAIGDNDKRPRRRWWLQQYHFSWPDAFNRKPNGERAFSLSLFASISNCVCVCYFSVFLLFSVCSLFFAWRFCCC